MVYVDFTLGHYVMLYVYFAHRSPKKKRKNGSICLFNYITNFFRMLRSDTFNPALRPKFSVKGGIIHNFLIP